MQRLVKSVFLIFALCYAFFVNGCIDKTLYPSTQLSVMSVEPYYLFPTASNTSSLPQTSIAVRNFNRVPCTLKGLSIKYYTKSNEEIPLLAINNQTINGYINGVIDFSGLSEEETSSLVGQSTFNVRPYTPAVVDLFELSASQISPIMAKITLHFLDVNSNWVDIEASCLLYKFEETTTTTTNATTGSRRSL